MTRTPKQKLRIACHPDKHGGDESVMEDFYALLKRNVKNLRNTCRRCPSIIGPTSTYCRICYRLPRLLTVLLVLLLAGCATSTPPQPQPVAAPRPQIAMRQQAIVEAPMLPIAPAAALVTAVPGKAVTFAWSPSPDTSVTGYQIYASTNNKLSYTLIGTATGTNVVVTNTVLPTYYFVTARDAAGMESSPSNVVGLLGQIAAITVTGQHAPTVAGPWIAYATPVFSGTTTSPEEVYRLAITRTNQWDTISTP